ncbi:hypothetical protein ACFQT0_31065 [Hymenobacter humi]|uniref:Uncharacterized protein n=1 Tax=Hymenobacter humi TaxID=1411620 RepID=A0ABW2UGM4_9BACT
MGPGRRRPGRRLPVCLGANRGRGLLAGGYSASGPGGDKTQASRGGLDYWLVKLSPVRILTAPRSSAGSIPCCAWRPPCGGVWRGAGITDSQRGLFSAAAAGRGDHVVRYEVGSGTSRAADSLTIAIRPVPMPVVSPRGVVVARCGPASGLLSVSASPQPARGTIGSTPPTLRVPGNRWPRPMASPRTP